MTDIQIELSGIEKHYGAYHALRNINLTIPKGQFVALVGPSGCGKSTLLRSLAGLERITGGTMKIAGDVMNDVPPRMRDIAMVFQSYALYPHMTVEQNLTYSLRMRKVPKPEAKRKAEEVAAIAGLSGLLDRYPRQLSGGQRQRVAMGRAIIRNPKAFLFDEPLSNLDAALRVSTRGEIGRLHRRLGATMIYVTHDQIEAMTLGHRICIMNGGKVVQVGPPLEVYRRPANTFVAAFLGNPPMNLLPACATGERGGRAVRLGEAIVELPATRCPPLAAGTPVMLGIRPENIVARPRDGDGFAGIEAEIVQVEALGAETILAARVAGMDRDLMARIGPASDATVGARRSLSLDLSAVHLFDAAGTAIVPDAKTR
jgi:multiple sugar transport system ATP-binding protein